MLTKTRHNKKRNTAFLYEALVRELTKCVVSRDNERKEIVVSLVREHFAKGTSLRQELDLYKALYETEELQPHMCEKLIYEVKRSHSSLDRQEIFEEQTSLINKINKMLSKDVFSNFVPNYKSLATISQILNPDVSVKHRVLLENNLANSLSSKVVVKDDRLAPTDSLVYNTFVKKFNDQYGEKLLEDQQKLLSKYITSFHDNGVELKIYLNEEIERLKSTLLEVLQAQEYSKNSVLLENTSRVLNVLNQYKAAEIDEPMIEQILKIQNLVEGFAE